MVKPKTTTERDAAGELRAAIEGCGAALVAIDIAVRKTQGYDGPPGAGLHRVLAMLAAQLGVTAPSFPPAEPAEPAEPFDPAADPLAGPQRRDEHA